MDHNSRHKKYEYQKYTNEKRHNIQNSGHKVEIENLHELYKIFQNFLLHKTDLQLEILMPNLNRYSKTSDAMAWLIFDILFLSKQPFWF